MKFIRSTHWFVPNKSNGNTIVYMCGYGEYAWQARRHVRLLQKRGYRVLLIDFKLILKHKDPQSLLGLMDEVADIFEHEHLVKSATIIVGISLGGLAGLNMLRRYPQLRKLLAITGGDVTRLPSERELRKSWKITREELARLWLPVNMYTPDGDLKGRHMAMVLPLRDKVIDPNEVKDEIALLVKHNNLQLITRPGGHLRTIVADTVLFPKRTLPVIDRFNSL